MNSLLFHRSNIRDLKESTIVAEVNRSVPQLEVFMSMLGKNPQPF